MKEKNVNKTWTKALNRKIIKTNESDRITLFIVIRWFFYYLSCVVWFCSSSYNSRNWAVNCEPAAGRHEMSIINLITMFTMTLVIFNISRVSEFSRLCLSRDDSIQRWKSDHWINWPFLIYFEGWNDNRKISVKRWSSNNLINFPFMFPFIIHQSWCGSFDFLKFNCV